MDPLTASYPWYTPYQFAGNKPIKFIDLDGLEESAPVIDPAFAAKLVQGTAKTIATGLYNKAISLNNIWRSEESKGNRIRRLLNDDYGVSYRTSFEVTNKELISSFVVRFSFFGEGYYLEPRGGLIRQFTRELTNSLDIAVAYTGGAKGNGTLLFAKTGSSSARSFRDVVVKTVKKWAGDVSSGKGRDHVTYTGIKKDGTYYVGYASAPSHKNYDEAQIISYRYGGDFSDFLVNPVAKGSKVEGVAGKAKARGLEQSIFQDWVKKYGRTKVGNSQNPVGPNNSRKDEYMKAVNVIYEQMPGKKGS